MDFVFYGEFSAKVRKQGIEETSRLAFEKGFSGVEFLESSKKGAVCTLSDTQTAKAYAETLKKYGLYTACYSVESCILDGETENLKKHAELASALGSPFLHHTLIPWLTLSENTPSYEEALQRAVESASKVASYAEKLGITCLYEEQGMYFNGQGFRPFYEEMKRLHKNVGVCGDFGNNLFVDENPADFIEEYAKEIRHVHLKDYLFLPRADQTQKGIEWYPTKKGNWLKDCPLGGGVVEFDRIFRALQEANYKGAYALETGLSLVDSGMAFAKGYKK